MLVHFFARRAKRCDEQTMADIRKLASAPACVAIGETGLDFHRNLSPPGVQLHWFEEQVKLAIELKLPLFLHEREAFAAMQQVLGKYKDALPRICIHCFTGDAAELREYVRQGFYIGVTGFIAKKGRGKALREIVAEVPLNRLMVETDAPYMGVDMGPPDMVKQFRSRNEPAALPLVVHVVAESYGLPVRQVAQATTATAREFFGLV